MRDIIELFKEEFTLGATAKLELELICGGRIFPFEMNMFIF